VQRKNDANHHDVKEVSSEKGAMFCPVGAKMGDGPQSQESAAHILWNWRTMKNAMLT
jgi:uncharacterized protein (UPF0548 family)